MLLHKVISIWWCMCPDYENGSGLIAACTSRILKGTVLVSNVFNNRPFSVGVVNDVIIFEAAILLDKYKCSACLWVITTHRTEDLCSCARRHSTKYCSLENFVCF